MAAQPQLIPFAFEDHLVRAVKLDHEPWFVGRDVCRVLDIRNESQALERLDPDERRDGVCITDPIGREQNVIAVSEPGVFRLIFTSRKPEAERFKRWLAHDVLPSLRRNGAYAMPGRDAAAPAIQFPAEDRALSEHLAKIATLRECRLIHGPRAAARLWQRLGMPAVHESVVYEADEGRECLDHLLADLVHETDQMRFTLRDLIGLALDQDGAHHVELRERGIIVPNETGIVIANGHSNLHRIFEGTPWSNGRWPRALRKLPGATPHPRLYYNDGQHRGTFIPAGFLEEAAPARPPRGNVVPLRG